MFDFVYKLRIDKEDTSIHGFNGFWASEPFSASNQRQVPWEIDEVRFHYPAEHTFNGDRADLEMQIFHKVDKIAFACKSNSSALSLFFNLTGDSSLETNGFFEDFQQKSDDESTIDISKLLDVGAILKSYVIGYIGTDTMPLCSKQLCWYLYKTHFKITQDELDYFKKGGPDSNYRAANIAEKKEYGKFYYYQGFAAPKN